MPPPNVVLIESVSNYGVWIIVLFALLNIIWLGIAIIICCLPDRNRYENRRVRYRTAVDDSVVLAAQNNNNNNNVGAVAAARRNGRCNR